ncbi:MAG: hypothetical protein IPL49_15360 [Saprospirales bacterium]|nr:hypothetical protein [Saprospirales bacterium]
MPHTATFKLDGKESDIKSFSYSFSRMTEENGRPCARVRAGYISFNLASDDKHKEAIINWMSKPDQGKEGEIIIYADDEKTKVLKTIKFENAFVTQYDESYSEGGNTYESFVISCEKISIGAAKFDFKWPKA